MSVLALAGENLGNNEGKVQSLFHLTVITIKKDACYLVGRIWLIHSLVSYNCSSSFQ